MRSISAPMVATAAILSVLATSGRAEAKHIRFLGPHPITARYGGGFCYIEAPHMHAYAPDHQALYQQVGDEYVFTGDPTPFGYEGERHTFYGHHPVLTVGSAPVYCYLDGPHVHAFAPAGPEYKMNGDVAFYVGPFAPEYARMRQHRQRVINAEYRPYVAFRPTVTVTPPEEWHGEVWVAPPAVEVRAPGVYVDAPAVAVAPPSVTVSAPGVFVSPPGVVVAPPRPVVVAPPSPHVVVSPPGVYVGAPGAYVSAPGAYVAGPGRVHREHGDNDDQGEREHHDNGRHRGWYKHGRGED
jgi:hypothetical protein